MSTFGDIKTDVKKALGNRLDTETDAIANRAVNSAISIVAFLFDPIELRANATVTIPADSYSVEISIEAPRLWDILRVKKASESKPVTFIPADLIEFVVPAGTTPLSYYSKRGYDILTRPPNANASEDIEIYYRQYPEPITSNGTGLPFDGYDAQVTATAILLAQASFEESDMTQMWLQIAQVCGVSLERAVSARQAIQGLPVDQEG